LNFQETMDAAKEAVKEAITAPVEAIKEAVKGTNEAEEDSKGPSKRALEKARKKAEKASKKAENKKNELPARPKPDTSNPKSLFEEGWLKKVYDLKPTKEVVTRFPPEPNGFLHIGHSKAIFVDFNMAQFHGGKTYLRFDDTNPEKEEDRFINSIIEIVNWLGFRPSTISHSSDNFQQLYDYAVELTKRDRAYACSCTREEMNMQRGGPDNRGKRFACKHRSRPVEESLLEFQRMKDGHYRPGEMILRMKQSIDDPKEGNTEMWDLPAYRIIIDHPHPRTGHTWKIYPTYAFAHPLCDSLEGITHSLCTAEFIQARKQYDWLLESLDLKVPGDSAAGKEEKGPMQREFGRLKLEGTILSKRRLTILAEGSSFDVKQPDGTTKSVTLAPVVRGWDDPRLHVSVSFPVLCIY
jgi:glutaminyl-tRNA synthetase